MSIRECLRSPSAHGLAVSLCTRDRLRLPCGPQHETAERLEVLRRADQYEKALGIKDHMLWQTLQVCFSFFPESFRRMTGVSFDGCLVL